MGKLQVLAGLFFSGFLCLNAQESDCGRGWIQFNDHCYLLEGRIGSAYTWHKANQFCRDRGALLASVHSDEENEFIAKKAFLSYHPTVWLGLNSLKDNSEISWLDETPIDYTKVDISVVDNTRRCAALSSPDPSRKWLFMHCDTEGALVCKRSKDEVPRTISPPVTTLSPGNCPQDWHRTGNKCLKIFSSKDGHKLNHSMARNECMKLGSGVDLASIHDKEENMLLTELTLNEETNLWIGLSRITFTTFGWTDNTQLDYTNWAPGEPSSVAEGCTEFITSKLRSGFWNDISCRQMMGYVCQRFPDQDAATSKPPQKDCAEDGYVRYGESCYKVFASSEQLTWEEAEDFCTAHGGHLPSIHSGQEAAFFKRSLLSQSQGPVWIGLRTTKESVFFWSDGWPTTYLGFSQNFKARSEQCAFINANGTWNMEDCNRRRGFICKITEESRPDYPEMDSRPCPTHIFPLLDIGLKYCYAVRPGYQSWAGANMQCMKNDTTLASFHHVHELELLAPHLISWPKGFWIGQLRKYHGGFEWTDGSRTDFRFWDNNEPSEKSGNDCVVLAPANQKASAKDCSESYSYICKIPKE